MGLDYVYEIIARREDADRVLAAIADHVTADTRPRLRGVDTGDRSLTFTFPVDGALLRYCDDPGDAATGFVEVGYIYTSRTLGSRLALVRAAACTTGMSHLFEESPSVRNAFAEIGRACGALSVVFDRQDARVVQLWSTAAQLDLPDISEDADEYGDWVLAAAAAAAGGPPPSWPSWEERWLARDRAFYDGVGPERAGVPCGEHGCDREAVALSVLCRVHHFERVHRRRCPFQH